MSAAGTIDAAWRAAHPLPGIGDGQDKEERGRALVVGGSAFVPGALRLTGEALLRAGAGKVQLATIEAAAMPLGVLFPEAAMIALPADDKGEIAGAALVRLEAAAKACGALILGPGMQCRPHTAALVEALLDAIGNDSPVLLDAGAMTAMAGREAVLRRHGGRIVMTPHHGELAALTGASKEDIARDPQAAAVDAAMRFGSIVVLKSAETWIANGAVPQRYASKAPGLGTAGSGDVLAGVIGGLLARGMDPVAAAGWGVWLHGEAGQAASAAIGPTGYLARDLLSHIPGLMDAC
ncbi:MAG: NAD(P)H-hydrate dehydratase [Sphingomonas bacterium]|uniref:NAD(P)H-hydrate dehydratase n=1 Tax=Sphingomonas bacterium TaxID=1895847 RepID=UPI0026280D32|nr:NAD(P)H-hydrate dehydratase [Sphingomonas bacterium]MDB5705985.1 NAD(P)H-hydrate dehydratase [Sphingomonas bacterium]